MSQFWTFAEDQLMRELYADIPTADVAALLDRPIGPVYQRAAKLGLGKSAEFFASEMAARIQRGKQHPKMIASRIKPGTPAWNKGLKGVNGTSSTRFTPGRPASQARNYMPIGSHRLTRDGHIVRKVTDNPALLPARRWVAVHRLVWESVHGPIPAGYIVRFAQGKKTTVLQEITVDRLECISRAENVLRNSEPDPEIKRLQQLKGAISRQVNRLMKAESTHI